MWKSRTRKALERVADALEGAPEPRKLRELREEVHELGLEHEKLKRAFNSLRGKVYRDMPADRGDAAGGQDGDLFAQIRALNAEVPR